MVFIETPVFTTQIKALAPDDAYQEVQRRLLADPEVGDVIQRSGGLRKVRMALPGRGKRGGARVIYYWIKPRTQIYLLLAYAKNEQDDLTEAQLKLLRDLVKRELK